MLEFNVRFGDPETQALVPRIEDDLAVPLLDAACGRLTRDAIRVPPRRLRDRRHGLARLPGHERDRRRDHRLRRGRGVRPDGASQVFHAGTARRGDRLVTAGGRVLGVTALGDDLADARARAYAAADLISFDGMQLRRDIAAGRGRRPSTGTCAPPTERPAGSLRTT